MTDEVDQTSVPLSPSPPGTEAQRPPEDQANSDALGDPSSGGHPGLFPPPPPASRSPYREVDW